MRTILKGMGFDKEDEKRFNAVSLRYRRTHQIKTMTAVFRTLVNEKYENMMATAKDVLDLEHIKKSRDMEI